MASADFDYIRALLIAQTAEPEPAARGLLDRLRGGRSERRAPPLTLDQPGRAAHFIKSDPDQELLLAALCGIATTEAPGLEIETASPLPPPAPREAFGRRPDLAAEVELMLQTPVYAVHDDTFEAPYFPEDLMEPGASEPMRPWIKALRDIGPVKAKAKPAPEPADDTAPLAKRVRSRRAADCKAAPPKSLSQDLLEALALTLAREHDALCDRLLAAAMGIALA